MLGKLIDRFGVQAVMNRPYLGAGEINRIYAAENVATAYRMKNDSDDWAKWARENPEQAERLAIAEKLSFTDEIDG